MWHLDQFNKISRAVYEKDDYVFVNDWERKKVHPMVWAGMKPEAKRSHLESMDVLKVEERKQCVKGVARKLDFGDEKCALSVPLKEARIPGLGAKRMLQVLRTKRS